MSDEDEPTTKGGATGRTPPVQLIPQFLPDGASTLAAGTFVDAFHVIVSDSMAFIYCMQTPPLMPDLPGLREELTKAILSMRDGETPRMPVLRIPASAKILMPTEGLKRLRDLITSVLERHEQGDHAKFQISAMEGSHEGRR